jgi:hypothetical protein
LKAVYDNLQIVQKNLKELSEALKNIRATIIYQKEKAEPKLSLYMF